VCTDGLRNRSIYTSVRMLEEFSRIDHLLSHGRGPKLGIHFVIGDL
jgi:hypothetical protein